jgi:ADP-ribosylglycohydrolase
MLLDKIAKGDACGAGFEYAPAEFVRANNLLTGYVQHPKFNLVPGSYTDDTQMSIANALAIINDTLSREELAQLYVDCFKRDEREGYARGFYDFLRSVQDGKQFLAEIKPFSDKSGGCMRALPFGIYPEISTVKELSARQAAITHNTLPGMSAAMAAALMSHYFLYNLGPKAKLGEFLETHVPGYWNKPWIGPVGQQGWMSVRAAITAVMSNDRMTDILYHSIAFTGDVDTVAAMALGSAAASQEVKQDLPAFLHDGLENGKYGRDYLNQLDAQLMEKMASLRAAAGKINYL